MKTFQTAIKYWGFALFLGSILKSLSTLKMKTGCIVSYLCIVINTCTCGYIIYNIVTMFFDLLHTKRHRQLGWCLRLTFFIRRHRYIYRSLIEQCVIFWLNEMLICTRPTVI